MRITSSMMMRRYGSNIAMNTARLDKNGLQVSTFRKFQRGSEDPMSALKAMQVRRQLTELNQVTRNLDVAEHWLAQTEVAAMAIKDCIDKAVLLTIQGRNDTLHEDDRLIIAHQLKSIQKELLQTLNTQVAGKYLFGDANTKGIVEDLGEADVEVLGPPFSAIFDYPGAFVEERDNRVNVNPDLDVNDPTTWWYEKEVVFINYDDGDYENGFLDTKLVRENLWIYTNEMPLYYNSRNLYEEDNINNILDNIKHVYLDLGLGLRFDDNDEIIPYTVFDTYISGVEFIGVGKNNVYNLIGELADAFKDNNMKAIDGYLNGDLGSLPDYIDPDGLEAGIFQRLQKAQLNALIGITTVGERANFIEYLQDRNRDSIFLAESMQSKLEVIQPDKAIMDFKMQEVVYQACLQMGNYILQPSLMSYLK